QQHTYRHDLESFLYVFIWLCFVYGPKGKGKEPTNALRDWSTFGRTFKSRAKVKFCDMGFGFELLMEDYPA
ncbi:hypothetical protein E4U56_008006, partial [Claviceps arundinis]